MTLFRIYLKCWHQIYWK